MPSSHGGKISAKQPGRAPRGGSSGQIDILAAYDTRYPVVHSKRARTLPGNGAPPANPFGERMKAPDVGRRRDKRK